MVIGSEDRYNEQIEKGDENRVVCWIFSITSNSNTVEEYSVDGLSCL